MFLPALLCVHILLNAEDFSSLLRTPRDRGLTHAMNL
jgi:hypothetical protein